MWGFSHERGHLAPGFLLIAACSSDFGRPPTLTTIPLPSTDIQGQRFQQLTGLAEEVREGMRFALWAAEGMEELVLGSKPQDQGTYHEMFWS